MRDVQTPPRDKLEPSAPSDHTVNQPATNRHCASIVFAYCTFSLDSVREVLCINRQQYQNPIMYLDFPTQIWKKEYSNNRSRHRIDWQPDANHLVDPGIARLDGLYYDSAIQICPGRAIDRGEIPIFCPCALERASHVIAKATWHIIGLDDNAYHHEQIAGRLDAQYLQEICQSFKATLFYRAASRSFPRGADYWILPLSSYQHPQS